MTGAREPSTEHWGRDDMESEGVKDRPEVSWAISKDGMAQVWGQRCLISGPASACWNVEKK